MDRATKLGYFSREMAKLRRKNFTTLLQHSLVTSRSRLDLTTLQRSDF